MDFIGQILAVKKPQGGILGSLEARYREIGEKFGYVPVQAPVALCLKRPDSQVSIEIQFGGERAVEASLESLHKTGSGLCIFVTSSKARGLRLEEARALLLKKFQIKSQKFYFLDIETGRKITANVEWEKFSSRANRPDWAIPGPMPAQPIFRSAKKGKTKGK
ncbi:MAG: hypothetical protein V1822_00660 [Candidatus Micrarchaeota archaeon]